MAEQKQTTDHAGKLRAAAEYKETACFIGWLNEHWMEINPMIEQTTDWRPMSKAPRDGSSVMARRVPEDSDRDFSGVRIWWGKTSHVPLYGWCHLIGQDEEEVDLWHPDEWRYMVEELDD